MTTTRALREIDRPLYNYWQALYRAFFSPSLYVDVAKRWKGFGFFYLLFLIALTAIPFGIISTFHTKDEAYGQVIKPLEEIPPIYIKNGQVLFNELMPYKVKSEDGQVILIIDTTGSIQTIDTSSTSQYPNLLMLVTKDKLLYRVPGKEYLTRSDAKLPHQISEQKFPKDINQTIVFKDWLHNTDLLKILNILLFLVYPSIVFSFFGLYITLFFAFSLMGQFIAKLYFDLSLTYKQSVRLFIVSSTPYMVLMMLLISVNFFFPGAKIILLIILLGYFLFAARAVRNESRHMVLK